MAMTKNYRPESNKASGFVQNSTFCDGAGWVPEKNSHTDQFRTLYRMQFCQDKPFHKTMTRFNDGRLPIKAMAYDKQDWRGKSQPKNVWKP